MGGAFHSPPLFFFSFIIYTMVCRVGYIRYMCCWTCLGESWIRDFVRFLGCIFLGLGVIWLIPWGEYHFFKWAFVLFYIGFCSLCDLVID
ncbi:hypothetical protein F4861DRAFT_520808 [Xylaria intraflava]|nr:hypothetical protein F4861DRAFT_520808 [Xylaria intraflava]